MGQTGCDPEPLTLPQLSHALQAEWARISYARIQRLIQCMPRRCRCHMHCRKNGLGFHEPGFRDSFSVCQGDVTVTCTAGRMGGRISRARIQRLIQCMPRRCHCHMHCRKNELEIQRFIQCMPRRVTQ